MEPLVLFHHIDKTGGTSIRELIRANYRPHQLANLDDAMRDQPVGWERDLEGDPTPWYHEWYGSLDTDRRAELRCVMGHTAPFLAQVVTDRPVRVLCVLRDPVDRVLSLIRFVESGVDRGASGPSAAIVLAMRERGWRIADAYRELGGLPALPPDAEAFLPLFNGQVRHVLLGTLPLSSLTRVADPDSLADYRRRALEVLSDRYVVGTQDCFSQSIRLFGESFGWRRVFVPRANVGPHSRERRTDSDAETRRLIREHNAVDAELHALHSERLRDLPGVRPLPDTAWKVRRRARAEAARVGDGLRRVRGASR